MTILIFETQLELKLMVQSSKTIDFRRLLSTATILGNLIMSYSETVMRIKIGLSIYS